jgi:hypothetical protein
MAIVGGEVSMSIISSASGEPSRNARNHSLRSVASNMRRLARPVSASVDASADNSALACPSANSDCLRRSASRSVTR